MYGPFGSGTGISSRRQLVPARSTKVSPSATIISVASDSARAQTDTVAGAPSS